MSRAPERANMRTQAERIPQFFKVFNATKYSNQLHIPSAYASHMQGNLPNRAFLSDWYGNMWPVELAKIESEWYFGEGWAKVAQDNSLDHMDFVIFQFDGEKIFYFKIIGRNSCNKVGVGCLKFHLEDMETERGEREEEEMVQESKLHGRGAGKFCRGGGAGQEETAANAEKKRKAYIDFYGADIFRSGLLVQPKNPYFVAKIRPNRRQELYVPVDVIKDFRLNLPEKITLRDPAGRSWQSELTTWKDGRTFYTGGWESFCRVNLIEDEDKCVCEFVQGQGEQVLQIQIVRNQNAPPP